LGNYPEERLYDLQEDPMELANVAKDYPDVVATLKALLDKEK
jgi:arylsulfatase